MGLIRDQTRSVGMCPEWELNSWSSSLPDNTPTNWATLDRAQSHAFCYIMPSAYVKSINIGFGYT